jgi:hypothetical protein
MTDVRDFISVQSDVYNYALQAAADAGIPASMFGMLADGISTRLKDFALTALAQSGETAPQEEVDA